MKKISAAFFAVVSMACVGASETRAGDLYGYPYHNWSGIYLGGELGGFWSNIDGSFVNPPFATWNSGPSGGIGGAFVGVQQQFGNFVLGIEGSYVIRSMRAAQISVILHPRAVQGIPRKGLLAASGRLGPVLVGMLDSICRTSPAATPARRSRTMLSIRWRDYRVVRRSSQWLVHRRWLRHVIDRAFEDRR